MGAMGREYRAGDVPVPPVTPQMLAAAIRVVLGAALDADDAEVLTGALGITRDDLVAVRTGQNGRAGRAGGE
jgi:hypothetical protein